MGKLVTKSQRAALGIMEKQLCSPGLGCLTIRFSFHSLLLFIAALSHWLCSKAISTTQSARLSITFDFENKSNIRHLDLCATLSQRQANLSALAQSVWIIELNELDRTIPNIVTFSFPPHRLVRRTAETSSPRW